GHARLVSDWSSDVCSSDLLGEEGRRTEDRQLRRQRGQEMAAVAPPPVVRVDRDAMDQGVGGALAADQHSDRGLPLEGDHAGGAPDVELTDLALERLRGEGTRGGIVARPAPSQRGGQEGG